MTTTMLGLDSAINTLENMLNSTNSDYIIDAIREHKGNKEAEKALEKQ